MTRRRSTAISPPLRSAVLSVVVIGSYREDLAGLLDFAQRLIGLGLQVLHPPPQARSIGEDFGFVRLDCDRSRDPGRIQRYVFSLIDQADAVILYAPSGRVGISAAMEIGYALRASRRIFATAPPQDLTIRTLIRYQPEGLTKFLRAAAVSDDTSGYAKHPVS